MEGNSIRHRLVQNIGYRSPKHAFLLQDKAQESGPTLRPKKLQQSASTSNLKPNPIYKHVRTVLHPLPSSELTRKKPIQVQQEKLSKEAKFLIEESKHRIRSSLKPHDIFQLYENFPEMVQDFFYLNRMEHPYDYQIVTYANRNPGEYMTISSQGVTLYHDKEAEFLTRQKWLTDEKRYYALQKIDFFRQYKISKNFRIWKNKMRRHYMREMSAILNDHLFFTMKYPRDCLLQLKHLSNTLKDTLHFFPFDNLDKLSPADFLHLLDQHREKTLLRGVMDITQAMTERLSWAVNEQINKFRAQNNLKIEGVSEGQSGTKEGYVYSQEAILKKQYKRVFKLIKLADSMLQQAKIQMILRCLEELVDRIRQIVAEDKEPWLACTVTIDEQGTLHWQPSCQDMCSLFLHAVKKNIKRLNDNNQKIVNNPLFAKYKIADSIDVKTEEVRMSLKAMVEESPRYFRLLDNIEEVLGQQFGSTKTQEANLKRFINIYQRHRKLGPISTIFKVSSGVDLCNYVDEWKKDEKQMALLPEDKKGHLLLYNYTELRKNIIHLPKQTLASFFALLPDETSQRCRDLTAEARGLLESISIYPTDIISFAKFNKAVRAAAERLQDIRSAGSEICLLIDLMSKNKLSSIQIYNSKKLEALNSINALKSKVEESEAKQNQSLSRFKRQNELDIARIKSSAKELQAKFNAIDFNQAKATAREMKQILAKIRQILPAVKALENQSNSITEIQIQLSLIQTDFSDVHCLHQNILLVNDTWTCRDQWKNMLLNLYHKHYTEVDCQQLRRQWQSFEAQISALSRTLPENQILKNLCQQLSEVEVLIDTITALRSPNLQEKAWRQISEYLAYELGIESEGDFPFRDIKNQGYTVKWLLEINIPVYKEKIEFIVRKSQKERELVVQLSDFKNYLSTLTFETIQKKNQFYIFAENKEHQVKLRQNLHCLYTMIDSQYSQSVQNQAETLIKHYEYVQEICKAVLDFGSLWSKYEPFFDLNSGSLKFLTKESKEFSSWETQWKKIIKVITTDSLSFYRKVSDETAGTSPSRTTIKHIAKINTAIDQVTKGLEEYLERKRATFPRYYFVPDQQLLQMFGSVDPKQPITANFVPIIYKHLRQINYRMDTKDTLVGVVSKEGEQLQLKQVSFKLQSEMQDIFKLAEEQIKKRINSLIKGVFMKYTDQEMTRQQMILDNNTQIVLAVDFVSWVRLAEETYLCPEPIGDLYDWIAIQQDQIKELKHLLKNNQSKLTHNKLAHLMSQSLYMLEKTQQLLKANITTIECYEWERIPKLCLTNNNSDIYFKQLTHRINYCYEFLGGAPLTYIEPQTEKAWLNISQAIANKDAVCIQTQDSRVETVRSLSFMVGQEVQQIAVGQSMTYKIIDRFINGGLYTGHWVIFNQPKSQDMLAFIANQVINVRKMLLDNIFQKNKSSLPCNNNLAFFVTSLPLENCPLKNLLSPMSHRDLTLYPPSWLQTCNILAECNEWPSQAANKVVGVCESMRDCFDKSYCQFFSHQFVKEVFSKVMEISNKYQWLRNNKCKQFYEYIICEVLDDTLAPRLRREDKKVYDIVKAAIVPDYEKYKQKHLHPPPLLLRSSIVSFLETKHLSSKNPQYVDRLEALVQAVNSDLIGIFVVGETLSGKSTLIQLAAEFIEGEGKTKITRHKIYHDAYNPQSVFRGETAKGIVPSALCQSVEKHWIILDGVVSTPYLQLFGRQAEKYIVPQYGLISSSFDLKFISETCQMSGLSPSIVDNHRVIFLTEDLVGSELMVRKQIVYLKQKGLTVNLTADSIEYLSNYLSSALSKLQNRTAFRSKLINAAYPLNNSEITYRCCRFLRAIFVMNWESIRDKQKNIRKMIQRMVAWMLYWCLSGIVLVEDHQKLQKLIGQLTRPDNFAPEELSNSIIYPNCGLDVQLITGLRTQSSLGIPEKGMITNVLRTDLNSEADGGRTNKFFQEIVISEAHLIRVNYSQSNRFSYVAQMSALTHTPTMLIGPQNSGKKTILEIFAKNMRGKSQFYSTRYRGRQHLNSQIEYPFRRFSGLSGMVMKSPTASKRLLVSIEDIYLDNDNTSTCQLLRMLFNEGGYYNSQAQWISFSNCSFSLIASKIGTSSEILRLMPCIQFFQTAPNTYQKLHSIYAPYLKNWAAFNGLSGEVERVFNSDAGDTLLDGVLMIYKALDNLYRNEYQKDSIEGLLMKPRIGDISRVLTYICRTPQANHYNMAYYYELWAHELVRVFADRLNDQKAKQVFFKELRKQALVKFKENFNLNGQNMFVFTSLGIENEHCYIRVQDPAYLHNYISNLLQGDQISLPLKYLFQELLNLLLRIYRIMSVEGNHLLLLSHNEQTAKYLIQLACQVGENCKFDLTRNIISVQKHIEPTLELKENVCFNASLQDITEETTYQIACLLNNNVYQFPLQNPIKEKIQDSITKKERHDNPRKQTKMFGKSKNVSAKQDTKEDDLQQSMAEQFMTYAHFIIHASPLSRGLKPFLKNSDLSGKFHFSWANMPQSSIVKASRQILSFDQELEQLKSCMYDDERLIDRVRKIYCSQEASNIYFNDFLSICEVVKSEGVRLSNIYSSKVKEINQGRENLKKVKQLVVEKEEAMKRIHQALEEVNLGIEIKCKELENIVARIAEFQLGSEVADSDKVMELKVAREELEIDLKMLREQKDNLEPQKKKILKGIKIGNDYLELFHGQFVPFDQTSNRLQQTLSNLQENLILSWCAVSFLAKAPVQHWVPRINEWIQCMDSSRQKVKGPSQIVKMMSQFVPQPYLSQEYFCWEVQIKIRVLFWLLQFYEDSTLYGSALKVADPKGLLKSLFSKLPSQSGYSICLNLQRFDAQRMGEIELACKSRSGIILIEKSQGIDDLEREFGQRRMVSYLNKVIVVAAESDAHVVLDCHSNQIKPALIDLILSSVNPGLSSERKSLLYKIGEEEVKQKEALDIFFRACASINPESQTYIEEVNKCKLSLNKLEELIISLQTQLQKQPYLEMSEFTMNQPIVSALKQVWQQQGVGVSSLQPVYQQALSLLFGEPYSHLSIQSKSSELSKIVSVNLGKEELLNLEDYMRYGRNWKGLQRVLVMEPSRTLLDALRAQFKVVNLLAVGNPNELNAQVVYNIIPQIHREVLQELFTRQRCEGGERVGIIAMASQHSWAKMEVSRQFIKVMHKKADETNKQKQGESSIPIVNYLMRYLRLAKPNCNLQSGQFSYLQSLFAKSRNSKQFAKRIIDATNLQHQQILQLLVENALPLVEKSLTKMEEAISSITPHLQPTDAISKQDLPFSFNLADIHKIKDPLTIDLAQLASTFNQQLKKFKEGMRESEHDWISPNQHSKSAETIQRLIREYERIKNSLAQLQGLSGNNITNRSAYLSQTQPQENSSSPRKFSLIAEMATRRTLCLVRCRWAKRMRMRLSNVGLCWKISPQNSIATDNGGQTQFLLAVALEDGLQILKDLTGDKKVQIVATPFDLTHDAKQSSGISLPIVRQHEQIGRFELSRSQMEKEKLLGLIRCYLVVE